MKKQGSETRNRDGSRRADSKRGLEAIRWACGDPPRRGRRRRARNSFAATPAATTSTSTSSPGSTASTPGVTAFLIRTGRRAPTTAPASRASSSIRRSPGCWARLWALIFPWSLAPIVLTFLMLAGTGLATRALALEALDDLPATLAGCAALFSGFALFTAYERSAFPEFAGGVLAPAAPSLCAARPAIPAASRWRRRAFDGSRVPLALVLAARLALEPSPRRDGQLSAGAVALLWALVNKTWAPLLRAALATAAWPRPRRHLLAPRRLERHWVDIRQATEDPGYDFENNWLFAHHANPLLALHDAVLRQASWIAVSMIAVALAGLLVGWRRGTLPIAESTARIAAAWWIPLAAIPVVVLFLLFPISRPVWHLLPEMPFLQYPWRWLEAVEAPMAIFFVAAVWPTQAGAPAPCVVAACAAAFWRATVFAGTYFFQVCYPEDTVASMLAAYHAGAGFEGMYEYEPPGADNSEHRHRPSRCLPGRPTPRPSSASPIPDDPDSQPRLERPIKAVARPHFTTVDGDRDQSRAPSHSRRDPAARLPGPAPAQLSRLARARQRRNSSPTLPRARRRPDRRARPARPGRSDRRLDHHPRCNCRPLDQRHQRIAARSAMFA